MKINPLHIIWALLGLVGMFILYQIYDFFFGDKMVKDEDLNSAEQETQQNMQNYQIDDEDLTINHTQAQLKADIIHNELDSAWWVAINYREAPIDNTLQGLTIADKELIIKKFGLKPVKVGGVFGLGGETKNMTMRQFAKEVLTQNDFNHISNHFINCANFV